MYAIRVTDTEGNESWLSVDGEPVTFDDPTEGKTIAITGGAIRYREWEVRSLDE